MKEAAKIKQKGARIAMLVSEKVDLNTETIQSDQEGHYVMIRKSTQQEGMAIVNVYVPNARTPAYFFKNANRSKGRQTPIQ